jgi:hypothetical protein
MPQFLHIAAAGIAKEFRAAYGNGSNLTTYTFTGCDFGAADASREVFVVIGWAQGANRTLNSVTIGGVAATLGSAANYSTAAGTRLAFAAVPTGATGDVVCTFSGGITGCCIAVYRVTDRPVTGAAETDFAFGTQAIGTSVTISGVDVAIDGFTLSSMIPGGTSSSGSPSGVNVALDATATADNPMYFGSSPVQSASGSGTVTWTWTTTANGVGAAWSFS